MTIQTILASSTRDELFEIFGEIDTADLQDIQSVITRIIASQQGAFG